MPSKSDREVEVTLKNMLSKHDTMEGNRLSLEGFLSYYREVAATDPRQASLHFSPSSQSIEDPNGVENPDLGQAGRSIGFHAQRKGHYLVLTCFFEWRSCDFYVFNCHIYFTFQL